MVNLFWNVGGGAPSGMGGGAAPFTIVRLPAKPTTPEDAAASKARLGRLGLPVAMLVILALLDFSLVLFVSSNRTRSSELGLRGAAAELVQGILRPATWSSKPTGSESL